MTDDMTAQQQALAAVQLARTVLRASKRRHVAGEVGAAEVYAAEYATTRRCAPSTRCAWAPPSSRPTDLDRLRVEIPTRTPAPEDLFPKWTHRRRRRETPFVNHLLTRRA